MSDLYPSPVVLWLRRGRMLGRYSFGPRGQNVTLRASEVCDILDYVAALENAIHANAVISGTGPNALSNEGEISKPNKSEFKKRGAGQ